MRRTIILAIACAAVAAGCGSSTTSGSSSSTKPAGVDASIWNDYCSHGAALVGYISQESKGTITQDEFQSKLNGSQNGIQGDADATTDAAMHAKFQAMADAIGRAKVAISTGDVPDDNAIVNAATAIGTC